MRRSELSLASLRSTIKVIAFVAALSAFFATSLGFAQEEDLGPSPLPKSSVTGKLFTHHNEPVPFEILRFRNAESDESYFTETRQDGGFTIALPAGHYSLELQRGQKFPASIVISKSDTNLGHLMTPLTGAEAVSPMLRSEMEQGTLRPGLKANVTGMLVTLRGEPSPNHQIHFENLVSKDIFLLHTKPDGSFSIYLPPGTYYARLERGAKLGNPITIADNPVDIGRLVIPAPLYIPRLFQMQGFGEAIVTTPAPSTANVSPSRGAPLHGAGIPPLLTGTFKSSAPQQATPSSAPQQPTQSSAPPESSSK
jgi:hypothetical protein